MSRSSPILWPNGRIEGRPDVRLFCLPHAGGAASMFWRWHARLSPLIEVAPVQLPGRETRLDETPLRAMEALVAVLVRELEPYRDVPYALLGHSMGALIAFELARALRRRGEPPPVHLFVTARAAPHCVTRLHGMSRLDDAALVAALRRMGGSSAALDNQELLTLVLPILRADFELCDSYVFQPAPALPCPIAAYGGRDDGDVPVSDLEAWAGHTTGAFTARILPGDHFFFREHEDVLIREAGVRLAAAVPA